MITELTQSSINMFFKCGVQFENRYVRGLIIPPGVAARKGSGVHEGARYNYQHVIDCGKKAPLDEVKDATRDKFTTLCNEFGVFMTAEDEVNKDQIIGVALDESVNSASYYHKKLAGTHKKIKLLEKRLKADIGLPLPISGQPDFVDDKSMVDIKTGKRWAKGREDGEIQPTIYKMLLRHNGYGDMPAKYEILTNLKNAPKDNPALWDKKLKVFGETREAFRTEEDEKILIRKINVMIKMLERGDFLPAAPGSWWCSKNWCGYHSICPYIKRGV